MAGGEDGLVGEGPALGAGWVGDLHGESVSHGRARAARSGGGGWRLGNGERVSAIK
jgi:hypothetical protein